MNISLSNFSPVKALSTAGVIAGSLSAMWLFWPKVGWETVEDIREWRNGHVVTHQELEGNLTAYGIKNDCRDAKSQINTLNRAIKRMPADMSIEVKSMYDEQLSDYQAIYLGLDCARVLMR